jgi:hypothetical protein
MGHFQLQDQPGEPMCYASRRVSHSFLRFSTREASFTAGWSTETWLYSHEKSKIGEVFFGGSE